jgi:myo-inositol-1(or 4)-monophosphatase
MSGSLLPRREIAAFAKLADSVSRSAGAILLRGFNRRFAITYKGRINPVTEFDIKAERHIIASIRKQYPDHDVLAEESTAKSSHSPYRWIIDPLDGTVNYAHGFPVFCVSIALEYDGQVMLGVVFDPIHGELFSAVAGRGAFLNGKRVHVSRENRLERSMIATGFAYDVGTAVRNNIGYFGRMVRKAQAVRRAGSAALDTCWVACGIFDGFWELSLHPWDTAAAHLILLEAGGKITQMNGRPYSIYGGEMVASNGRIHGAMLRVLNARRRNRRVEKA